jgi:malate dehydrogenase
MFGEHTPIHMLLIELPCQEKALNGIIMEIKDGAYEPVKKIEACFDYEKGFKDLDALVCLGSVPRGPGMVRSDLLLLNAKIFKE